MLLSGTQEPLNNDQITLLVCYLSPLLTKQARLRHDSLSQFANCIDVLRWKKLAMYFLPLPRRQQCCLCGLSSRFFCQHDFHAIRGTSCSAPAQKVPQQVPVVVGLFCCSRSCTDGSFFRHSGKRCYHSCRIVHVGLCSLYARPYPKSPLGPNFSHK